MRIFKPIKGATEVIYILLISIIVLAGGIYFLTRSRLDTVQNAERTLSQEGLSNGMASTSDDMSAMATTTVVATTTRSIQRRTDLPVTKHWVVLAGTSAPLYEFNKAAYEEATKSDKLVVLYFYADWCPFCVAEYPILKNVFNEMTRTDVVGFRVHYNDESTGPNERALARQFGVGYQHTKVFLKKGARVLKSPETWTKERYILEISKF